jgi:hypothetical protein
LQLFTAKIISNKVLKRQIHFKATTAKKKTKTNAIKFGGGW